MAKIRYSATRPAGRYAKRRRKTAHNPVKLNKLGGAQPQTAFELIRARAVDLVTLPRNISGTNCGNCQWLSNGFCKHKLVQMSVTKRQCCALWNRHGTMRATKVV